MRRMGIGQKKNKNGTEKEWELSKRRMGMRQNKDGNEAEEGWEWDRRRMGMGQKKDGKEKEEDRKGTKESLERTVEGWEGQKKIIKGQKKCVHVTEER
jgi:hypothetical protein